MRVEYRGETYELEAPEVVTNRHGICFDAARFRRVHPYRKVSEPGWISGGGFFPIKDVTVLTELPEQLRLALESELAEVA